jgi:hypothetical protein
VVGGWLVAATLLQLLRQRGVPAVDTIWAEDGTKWLTEAWLEGPIGAFAEPYAGYYHGLPRLLGGAISLVPLRWSAATLAVVSAAIVAALAAFVYGQSEEVIETRWARGLLALLVVVPPPGAWETTANITNLQWNLLYPCFWALAVAPRSRGWTVAATLVVAVTALSAPVSIVFVPLAVWAWLRWPGGRGRVVGGVFLLGTAVQVVISLSQGAPEGHETHLVDLAPLYAVRVGAGLLLGEPALVRLWPGLGWGLALIGGAVAALLALGAVAERDRRIPLVIAAAGSFVSFAVPVYLRGTSLITPGQDLVLNGSKWVLGPMLLLATVLVGLADRPPGPGWMRVPVRVLIAGSLAFAAVTSYSATTSRSEGPRWSGTIETATGECHRTGAAAVDVPVTPKGFSATIPCERLTVVRAAEAPPQTP